MAPVPRVTCQLGFLSSSKEQQKQYRGSSSASQQWLLLNDKQIATVKALSSVAAPSQAVTR